MTQLPDSCSVITITWRQWRRQLASWIASCWSIASAAFVAAAARPWSGSLWTWTKRPRWPCTLTAANLSLAAKTALPTSTHNCSQFAIKTSRRRRRLAAPSAPREHTYAVLPVSLLANMFQTASQRQSPQFSSLPLFEPS